MRDSRRPGRGLRFRGRKSTGCARKSGKSREANEPRLGTIGFAESEARIRDLFIDVLPREAGWDPDGEHVREYEVHGIPAAMGAGFADYAPWGDNGLPLPWSRSSAPKTTPARAAGLNVGLRSAYPACAELVFRGWNCWTIA